MNRNSARFLLAVLAVVALVGVAAAEETRHEVKLLQAGKVGANVLEPGPYMVSWKENGDKLTVEFRRIDLGEKFTASATKITIKKSDGDAEVIYGPAPEKGAVAPIKEIRFHSKSFALEFE